MIQQEIFKKKELILLMTAENL